MARVQFVGGPLQSMVVEVNPAEPNPGGNYVWAPAPSEPDWTSFTVVPSLPETRTPQDGPPGSEQIPA